MTEYINCKPTPQGLVDMLLMVYEHGDSPKARAEAHKQLHSAMRVAYSVWYPTEYPLFTTEDKIDQSVKGDK